jgi:hypothetical protein
VELHPQVLSVPLVVSYPGVLEAREIKHPVSLMRLAPSLLSLVGIEGEGALSNSFSLFSHRDELISAGVWGFSGWATHVDSKFSLRRRWYREGDLGGWVDEAGGVFVCLLSIDKECRTDVSANNEDWTKKIISLSQEGFASEKDGKIDEQAERLRLEKLRQLGYIGE